MPSRQGPFQFFDRAEAGRYLSVALGHYTARPDAIVLGLPRGGVIVAAQVAKGTQLPLEVVVCRKIRSPGQPELARGALAVWGERVSVVRNAQVADALRLGEDFDADQHHELDAARARAAEWSPTPPDITGQVAIVVDDGLATGATMRAALDVLRAAGAGRLVVAVPVAAERELADMRRRADEVVCVYVPPRFVSVGSHYVDFDQIADAAVGRALAR